jgi:hypothetical protein
MPLDRTVLGNAAAEQMDALDEVYGEDPSAEVGAVMTIVQIVKRQPDGGYTSAIRMRHNVGDPYTAIGVIRAAEMTITQQILPGGSAAA